MGMIEDLYIKVRSKINEFGKTTGKYVDISKLKIKIAECEDDINKKLQKIGRIVFEKVQNNEEIEEIDILDIVNEIKKLEKLVSDYDTKINKLKGKCVCRVCKSINSYDSQFCSSCGSSLVDNSFEKNENGDCDNNETNNSNFEDKN